LVVDYPEYRLNNENICKIVEASKYYDIGTYLLPRVMGKLDNDVYKHTNVGSEFIEYGLKNFIEKEFYGIDMFRVYVKSFDEYKGVEYKYCVNQESEKITDFSIPSLAEFFPVNFTNGKNGKRITIPYFAGVVPCLSLYKEYVAFVISEYFIEGEPFEVKGHVTYDGKRLSYVVMFDGKSGYGEFSEM
jgi:hypothetical protein